MKLDELIRFAGVFFENEGVEYFVFGATAMNFWVPPRNTVDLDIVLDLDKRAGIPVIDKLKKHGFRITRELTRKFFAGHMVKLPSGGSEMDLKLCKSEHDNSALTRSRKFSSEGFTLRIATPEDLVLFKLKSWRRQDQADIERILGQRLDLDIPFIESWLDRLSEETGAEISDRWKEINAESDGQPKQK